MLGSIIITFAAKCTVPEHLWRRNLGRTEQQEVLLPASMQLDVHVISYPELEETIKHHQNVRCPPEH
jgi:hypothetical protein